MTRKAKALVLLSTATVLGLGLLPALRDLNAQGPGFGPPGGGFGPQGPGGPGGPGGFGPGMFLAPAILRVADADDDGRLSPEEGADAARKLVAEADAGKKGSIDAAALGRAINKRIGPPPGVEGPGPGEDDGEFGPGTFFAPVLLEAADANKDGKLTPDEAAKAAETFLRNAAKTPLEQDRLAQAINQGLPRPGGMGGPGGPGGMGGPMGAVRKLVKNFDADGNGRLDAAERKRAREQTKQAAQRRFGPPPGMFGGQEVEASPGKKLTPADAESFPGKPLYDPSVVRTLFFEFESKDWEAELASFYKSDVEVPAKLIVDGKTYKDVGVHFRGMSSYFTVREGQKRSLNVSIDFVDEDQRLLGYKTLNLLNSHEDSSLLHTVLYFDLARKYIPAPKANLVKVVINGEYWGVYTNVQQFDKVFVAENFQDKKGAGARWKVPGNPGADGGLRYLGEDVAAYKQRYELKTKGEQPWKDLIRLCKLLNETPPDELEAALSPILDIDGVLRFLALEVALINGDGYWVRASDYSIYLDPMGRFHILPHDANETFGLPMMMGPPGGGMGGRGGMGGGRGGFGPGGPPQDGPGGPPPGGDGFGPPDGGGAFTKRGPQGKQGGPFGKAQGKGRFGPGGPGGGGGNIDLDPLVGINDPSKPLRSKLLAVPSLRAKYLAYVKEIAESHLDWKNLGPRVKHYHDLIAQDVKEDTRKLSSFEAFEKATADTPPAQAKPARGRPELSLRAFADQRRAALLKRPEVKNASKP